MAAHLSNERALVAAAQLGNHEAFSVLINQYQQNIYRLALRITGNHEDAEDALQEALLKAYCNLKRFQGESLFYTWLVRITMNEALMKLRRSKRNGSRQLPIDEVLPLSADSSPIAGTEPTDPEKRYAQVELREKLCTALNGISGRLSDAFVLRNVADLSIRETAATLGLSVAGVKSRLLRARGRLRQRLSKAAARGRSFSHLSAGVRTTLLGSPAFSPKTAGPRARHRVPAHENRELAVMVENPLTELVRRAQHASRVSA